MYHALLISKYLRRKLAPLFAALAVTLCSAMVIIVISVMGGFLDMMRDSARRLSADVTVRSDVLGFPHYQELMDRLNAREEVESTAAIVKGFGLVKFRDLVKPVEVYGVEPTSFDAVTGFRDTLHWRHEALVDYVERRFEHADPPEESRRAMIEAQRERARSMDPVGWAMRMELPAGVMGEESSPGLVLGIHVSPFSRRDAQGEYDVANASLFSNATVTVLPLTRAGGLLEPSVRRFRIVNEFKSGLYEIDANRIFVPFEMLQAMMLMDSGVKADPQTGEPTGERIPPRASEVLVRGRAGVPIESLRSTARRALNAVMDEHPSMPPAFVETWREQHGAFLGAVEKEKMLVTILFAIISIVAFAMIAVIFYMIVLEKTRDIGLLRAIGAGRSGIASIFLGYGLTIGVIGSALGLLIAWGIVRNINALQDWLSHHLGFTMWNPAVYYFDRIPAKLDPVEVSWILCVAVLCSLLGAAIPAWRAARVDPIESLRYE